MFKNLLENLLEPLDITINGNEPQDIKVYDDRFFPSVLQGGSLALGETYMAGWWACDDLEELLYRVIRGQLEKKLKKTPRITWYYLRAKLFNLQTKRRSVSVAEKHYNLGNDLYTKMLDKYMVYSCGYWKKAKTLDEAQEAKLDLICRKLKLSAGQSVLDIGCGWGGFARYAAVHYHVKVVGISIAKEQINYAKNWCKDLDVEFRLQDYREINGKFDRIVSIGMFEHVGYRNYKEFMEVAKRNLKDDGIFLLHCIGGNEEEKITDPWINKYIFPNGMIPSPKQLVQAFEPYFMLEDWHNFGLDYNLTLRAWLNKFKENWKELQQRYDQTFYNMWVYYLSISAASFKAKYNNLWQVVLTKKGNTIAYISER